MVFMGSPGTGKTAAALLVGRPRFQVALPGHVVDVEFAADRVQEPDLVHHGSQQVDVMGNDHHAAGEVLDHCRNAVAAQFFTLETGDIGTSQFSRDIGILAKRAGIACPAWFGC